MGLSTLAGAAEKRVWIDQAFFNLYFNLYIVMIGPAGVVSKSTCMKNGTKLLKEAGLNVMEGAVIKEKIIEDMIAMEKLQELPNGTKYRHSSITYISNELNVMLSAGVDMIKFLVDIYDIEESYIYRTKNSGEYEISYPYFNMVAAAIPQWFGEYVGSDLGSTGFLARCIVVYEQEKRGKHPRPIYTAGQESARKECLKTIYKISELYQPLDLSEEADQYYCNWYMKQDTTNFADYRINAYLERKIKIHVLKIAALMCLGDDRILMEKIDFQRAIHILDSIEHKMQLAYIMSGNKISQYLFQIMNIIDSHDGAIKAMDLMSIVKHDITRIEFKEVMQTLEEMGNIQRILKGKDIWIKKMKELYSS